MGESTDVITAQEAAEIMQCDPATIYRYAKDGLLENLTPRTPLRRQPAMRFRRADVEHLAAHPPARKPRQGRH